MLATLIMLEHAHNMLIMLQHANHASNLLENMLIMLATCYMLATF